MAEDATGGGITTGSAREDYPYRRARHKPAGARIEGHQPVGFRNVTQGNVVYTNPENDVTVTRQFAGPLSDTTISGDPAGVHTHELVARGLSGKLRTPDGTVLLGAGFIILHEVFDGEEFVSREILVDRGPHPNLESDLALFCDVMTGALGLG